MKTEQLNYEKFVLKCDLLRNISPINLRTIQRLAYPFAKTTSLGLDPLNPTKITIRLRKSKRTISITRLQENYNEKVYYFQVSRTDLTNITLEISAVTCKEIMYKINHVYKLTKPKNYD